VFMTRPKHGLLEGAITTAPVPWTTGGLSDA
jgi:hypothetical protein